MRKKEESFQWVLCLSGLVYQDWMNPSNPQLSERFVFLAGLVYQDEAFCFDPELAGPHDFSEHIPGGPACIPSGTPDFEKAIL